MQQIKKEIFELNKQFEKLKENNQLEVKEAFYGIPSSIWETYSAFCNSYGGTILLGVAEDKNKNLHTCGLTESKVNNLLKVFWDTINNHNKVNINLLSDKDIKIQKINKDYILIITVPHADKSFRPIYINNNPLFSYRRNHEGDYRCTKLEIQSMLRDQEEISNDSQIIEDMDLSVINQDTLSKYRTAYNQNHKEDHPFVKENNESFLIHIGAAKLDKNGDIHPTKAGLLMFGNFYDITNIYPNYFLDYQDHRNLQGNDMRWSFRITSTSGDWSGNLYDFYYRIAFKLTEDIAVPFKMNGMFRDDSSPLKKAIREALCNTLSNADYHSELGLVIKQYHDKLVFSNPGILAMPLKQIMLGGESKARNKTVLNIFSFVNIGERAGSGYPLILKSTKEENYPTPELFDNFKPDVTKLTIFIKKIISKNENIGNELSNIGNDANNIGNELSNIGNELNYIGNDDNNIGNDDNNIGNELSNIGNDANNVGNKISFYDLIDTLNVKQEVKNNLIMLFEYFNDKIFGNIDIQKKLKFNKNTVSKYIRILSVNNIIESVSGYGKGKYKFK